jgi:hypothetical protein
LRTADALRGQKGGSGWWKGEMKMMMTMEDGLLGTGLDDDDDDERL